jgi:hypothetical protein
MDAAVAALIGAGMGAVVPALTTVFSSRQTLQDAREARLFDHRREGYAVFLSQARGSLASAAEWYWGAQGNPGPEPPEDALVPLANALAGVGLYGTPEAEKLAGAVLEAVAAFTFRGDSEDNYRAAENSIEKFVARARVDLGVPK